MRERHARRQGAGSLLRERKGEELLYIYDEGTCGVRSTLSMGRFYLLEEYHSERKGASSLSSALGSLFSSQMGERFPEGKEGKMRKLFSAGN